MSIITYRYFNQRDELIKECTFNEKGLLLKTVYPNGWWIKYFYNEQGKETRSINSEGIITHSTYDDKGNLIRCESSDGFVCYEQRFDERGILVHYKDIFGYITRAEKNI